MKLLLLGFVYLSSLFALPGLAVASAQGPDLPPVTINRFKVISGDQYVELKNNTDQPVKMDNLRLVYYNNYNLDSASSSKIISASGELPAHGYYLINDSIQSLCYQSVVASASLGFATTSGRIQLMQLAPTGDVANPIDFVTLDEAGWYRGSNPPAGAVHFPATSQSSVFALRDWQGREPSLGGGTWLTPKAGSIACTYEIEAEVKQLEDEGFAFLSINALPPVRYVSASTGSSSVKANRNVGKAAPIINELLPNPASPQTDADDEFIELYNPNDSKFDLTGFKIAFGSTKPRKYTFPEGTIMEPKSFKAFTSGDTSISLSNTEAQVWLLDPNEKVVNQSEPYSKAKDGQAWAFDNGKWVWTLLPTPGQMNSITGTASGDSKAKTAAATLGISNKNASGGTSENPQASAGQLDDAAPLHPSVLAIVGMAAVGYAIYEYRHDIANRVFQLRRYLRNRRALREPV